ncbi:hypothetical protein IAE19_02935 [Acinetobacter sp. S40]|uniref:hypothetical protein n=1 Tax=Acinetobacter sp. S40 TaxID=2767434 RepID=UPI00190BA596|nr:hypothetical protein [Acinetobacter sp. S40]MBJ9984396.1 hypothetical protein [Acinetobacter sp. S40]
MTQLINKGGFRERANRSRKYRESENEKTTLVSNRYQPNTKLESLNIDVDETNSPNSTHKK